MPHKKLVYFFLATIVAALLFAGCMTADNTKTASTTASTEGKIPITTASEEARKEFLLGRDLSERLLAQDSLAHFDKAISLDPNFALAELNRANSSPTTKEFFDHLKKAVTLADKASSGEKSLILGTEAGANANATKQKEYFEQLVAAYPNDERAHFLLGGYYFGQQEMPQAIEHYKKAAEINSNFSPTYNILGYAYRQNADYANAETAFKKYIELIPNDPNPYDSYAELLLKMGKFDDSITQYRKALAIDPNFISSYQGVAAALMYQGKADESAAELQKITDKARSDGDRRTAMFDTTVLHVDGGKMAEALADAEKQFAMSEKANDAGQMNADLQLKGNILLEMGKFDDARTAYDRALKTVEDSSLSAEIKDNARRFHHYNLATVALGKKDLTTAKSEAEAFSKATEPTKNPAQMRQTHQLSGMVALAEKDYDKAIAELQQANQQDSYNLYRMCLAYDLKGDAVKSKDFCNQAAHFNPLPALNHAFIRTKAEKMAAGTKPAA